MPHPFEVVETSTLEDTADREESPPIRVETMLAGGWPELHVCGHDGRTRGLASLDYHDGRLRVLIYDLTRSEEPKVAVTLAEADPSSLERFLTEEPAF